MSKKKLLIHELFEKGKVESGKDSKNGIALYLNLYFYDLWKFEISEKTFVRYYDSFLIKNEEKNIDTQTLNKISQYLNFKDFRDFCKTETFTKKNGDSSFTSVKVSIDDEGDYGKINPNITINVTTNPIVKLQEFFTKHSNQSIFGVILCAGFVIGIKMYKADDRTLEIINNRNKLGLIGATKQCMYWNGKEYIPEYCNDTKNDLIAIDPKKIANFKKITTPDTIKSVKGIWYSKYQNEVEFFTADGVNPDNGKELKSLTDGILNKYGN